MHSLQVQSTDANLMVELLKGKFSNGQNDFSTVPFLQASSSDANLLHANIFLSNVKPLYAFPAGELLERSVIPTISFDPGMQVLDSQPYSSNVSSSSNHLMNPPFPNVVASIAEKMMSANPINTSSAYNLAKDLSPSKIVGSLEDFAFPMTEYSLPNARGDEVLISRNVKPEESAQANFSNKRKPVHRSQVVQQTKKVVASEQSRARRAISDRIRKAKVSEGYKALQNALPFSDKGNQSAVLGGVIDYIKFLKLRLNVLSQSRLNGEASAYSFVHIEGYGHYLLHPHSGQESLEEKIGDLMKSNPQATDELLESKGLTLVPMDTAYSVLQHTRTHVDVDDDRR